MRQVRLLLLTLALLLPATMAWAQTGRISGQVVDAATGDPLPGVNVAIEGTTQGAITDIDGFYSIINVRPGTHSVRASFVGFTPAVAQDVEVNVGLTTELNFQMQEETVGLDEVVVTVTRPVVQRDVSASIANIDSEQMENLPVASVADVISLQAGFEPGLTIRGSGGNQVGFAVDGISFTDPRTNNPNTEVSYTAIDEVQVQTGGFNAEYGNVRSGLINVITKDPSRDRYTADAIVRYSAANEKHFQDFGSSFGDVENSFWAYPRLSRDEYPWDVDGDGEIGANETCEVSICGVQVLPPHLRTQYEQFGGWAALADDPITPEQLRRGEEWTYRKNFEIQEPDYEIDGTITGPVPGIGPLLGDLRFSASFRRAQEAYTVPGQRDAETRQTFQGKLVSDLAPGMRLSISGIHNMTKGIAFTGEGIGYRNVSAGLPGYTWHSPDYLESNLAGISPESSVWGDYFYSPHDHTVSTYGAEFTHTLSPNTFYEVQLQRNASRDRTGAPDLRLMDPEGTSVPIRCVTPGLELREINQNYQPGDPVSSVEQCESNEVALSEAPFGYQEKYEFYGGQAFGSQRGDARDTSDVTRWSGRFDITSQVNRFMQVKSGVEFLYSDYDVFYGSWDPANPHQENERYSWERSPLQGALYAQTKLEFQGMVANLGLRADYFHAGGEWYEYDPFSTIFAASLGYDNLDQVEQTSTERQLTLSPRLGISFPVTDDSKFYFNYGHFRQMPDPYRLFEIQYNAYTTQITQMGNPNITLPKTVAYELGFEQSFMDLFLVRLAGFYRDLSAGGRNVSYVSIDELVNYQRMEPLSYGDNRGFEITLEKNRGAWVRGFINYTYLSTKGGGFGFGTIYEDLRRFREYAIDPNNLAQDIRVPEPYANLNLTFLLPQDLGPSAGGLNPLGDWRITLLGEWRKGAPSTWDGSNFSLQGAGNDRRISYNVNWKDYWMFDLRLSKNFDVPIGRAQFFVDINNVFNIRQMYWRRGSIFQGENDQQDYFRSLHWPPADELFEGSEQLQTSPPYVWVPGDDQPGDYRKPGVDFQPIKGVSTLPDSPASNEEYHWHWDESTGRYMRWDGGSWEQVPQGDVDQVLDDKAYIDMPNGRVMAFLNPRNVFFGVRLSF